MYNNTNYRPLTVLNAAAKVFESLLSEQITEKIDTHLYELSAIVCIQENAQQRNQLNLHNGGLEKSNG